MLGIAVVEAIRTEKAWNRAMDALALSGTLCGVIGIFGWILWLGGIDTALMDSGRANSTLWDDPNLFGSIMAVTLILLISRLASGEKRSWLWASMALVSLALVVSQSRSAFMAVTIGLVIFALYANRRMTSTILLGTSLLVLVGITSYIWIGAPPVPGLSENRRFSTRTLETRIELWDRGLQLLQAESLAGIGPGSFTQIRIESRGDFTNASHNTYLSTLLELGIPGIMALGLVFGAIPRTLVQNVRANAAAAKYRIGAILASLAALLAFAFWVDALYQRHVWLLIGLAFCQFSPSSRSDLNRKGN